MSRRFADEAQVARVVKAVSACRGDRYDVRRVRCEPGAGAKCVDKCALVALVQLRVVVWSAGRVAGELLRCWGRGGSSASPLPDVNVPGAIMGFGGGHQFSRMLCEPG